MTKSNIHHLKIVKQVTDTKEGVFTMKGISFTNLLHSLIREYGAYHNGSYAIDAKDLSLTDMRLILSHILDSHDYEWSCFSNVRLETMYMEHIETIQTLLDQECHEVYVDDMESNGMQRSYHHDNGEEYWVRG